MRQLPRWLTHTKKAGFTLVELLVVSGITGLLLLTVSTMFMTVLVGRAQSSLREQVHTEGNEIIGRIEFIVRNSVSVENCGVPGSVFSTISGDKVFFEIPGGTTDLVMDVNAGSDRDVLNSASMKVTSFTLSCEEVASSNKKSVKLNFVLQHAETETTISETFTTWVQLRNS